MSAGIPLIAAVVGMTALASCSDTGGTDPIVLDGSRWRCTQKRTIAAKPFAEECLRYERTK
jgi:hypothetical protein